MKKFFGFNKLLASVAVLASVMIFQSCLDDDDNDYYRYALPNALVTVKPVADNSFFMQLDGQYDTVTCQYEKFSLW